MPRKKKVAQQYAKDYTADDIDAMFERAIMAAHEEDKKLQKEPPKYNIGNDGKSGFLWPVD